MKAELASFFIIIRFFLPFDFNFFFRLFSKKKFWKKVSFLKTNLFNLTEMKRNLAE